MKKLRIEINDSRYQKDFEIKEDTDLLLVIKKNTKTEVSFNVYDDITVRIKILSFCDSDSELFAKQECLAITLTIPYNHLRLLIILLASPRLVLLFQKVQYLALRPKRKKHIF